MADITGISNVLQTGVGTVGSVDKKASSGTAFSDILTGQIKQAADAQRAAEQMSLAAANGEDVPMHEVISAVSKAERTLQTMLNVRDKAVEAYQEILRMPI